MPNEWEEFGHGNQVCSFHYVSWLPEINVDIDILLDLKTVVVESQEWERVESLERKEQIHKYSDFSLLSPRIAFLLET